MSNVIFNRFYFRNHISQNKISVYNKKMYHFVRHSYLFFWLTACLLFFSCSNKISYTLLSPDKMVTDSSLLKTYGKSPCNDYRSYIPDSLHPEFIPMRYVRVNFHFMRMSDSSGNFNYQQGIQYANDLLWNANQRLEKNEKMLLPLRNNNPAYPIRFRYILAPDTSVTGDIGIYFHDNDSLYTFNKQGRARNIETSAQFDRYGVQKGKVINIFLMEHPKDSITSKTYNATGDGIGAGKWVKLSAGYQNSIFKTAGGQDSISPQAWRFASLFNHELGHCFGLSHTWNTNDGCDDTPLNPGCWNCSDSPKCDTTCSNNVMDYNACQCAYSPCQLGRIEMYFANKKSVSSQMLRPDWCNLNPDEYIVIQKGEKIIWEGNKDLGGNIRIENGGSLTIRCNISIPENASVTVEPNGELILAGGKIYNSCSKEWKGIYVPVRRKEWLPVTIKKSPGNGIENIKLPNP